jgi:hypothetical protein
MHTYMYIYVVSVFILCVFRLYKYMKFGEVRPNYVEMHLFSELGSHICSAFFYPNNAV